MTAADPPRPVPDRDSAPWWVAVRQHRLTVQRCGGCAALRFPPRGVCARCRDRRSDWIEVSGRASVASWIVTHHRFLPSHDVPYVVALVRLVEQSDLMMYGNVTGVEPQDVAARMPVRAVFRDSGDGLTLVHWEAEAPARGRACDD